jgi:anti-sigma-K factor RskA
VIDHEEIEGLLPGFALGCLDTEEESLVREHLAACASCCEELRSLRSVVDGLATTVPAARPPSDLEARILSALPRTPLPLAPRATHRPRSRIPPRLLAAAVLIVVLGIGNIFQWQRTRALLPKGKGLVTLALAGMGSNGKAFGTVVLDPEDNEGILAVRDLKSLDPARRYQLWLSKGGLRASGGLFSVDEHGYGSLTLDVPAELKGFDSFIVTEEPAVGSASPTGSPVMGGKR